MTNSQKNIIKTHGFYKTKDGDYMNGNPKTTIPKSVIKELHGDDLATYLKSKTPKDFRRSNIVGLEHAIRDEKRMKAILSQ